MQEAGIQYGRLLGSANGAKAGRIRETVALTSSRSKRQDPAVRCLGVRGRSTFYEKHRAPDAAFGNDQRQAI